MIDKKYNSKSIEKFIYKFWEKNNCFSVRNNLLKNNYCIVSPPPNMTGELHIGHAFQQSIIDFLIRYNRMQDKNTLLQFGIDHAGIATQILIEKKIFQYFKKNKKEYSRKYFIKYAKEWKNNCSLIIKKQMQSLGISVDWKRERFTMDKEISKVVNKVFVRLYYDNLLYRDKTLVHWDVKLNSALSDLEIVYKKTFSKMYYIKYPLFDGYTTSDGESYIVVGTVRPETILADAAIVVNPNDIRYRKLIGKYVFVPLIGSKIPILGDLYANIYQGSGCVKITPAHDFNDYNIGKKYQLPMINIFTNNGLIRSNPKVFNDIRNSCISQFRKIPKIFRKLDRFVARKKIVQCIQNFGFLQNKKLYSHIVPYGSRSNVIIEPMLKNQWFIRISSLAKKAIEVVRKKKIIFFPKVYKSLYFNWMNNIKDWCISRQIWWGHRIPVWYDKKNYLYVGESESDIRKKFKLNDSFVLYQEKDVLDTWFSSALWSFSSLDWPKKNGLWKFFHPTNIIISGFDIIFFWIARMIMFSIYCNDYCESNNKLQVPFKEVYITGLIKDDYNKKMSKTKNNVFDPLDIINGITLNQLIKKKTFDIKCRKKKDDIRRKLTKKFPNGIPSFGADVFRFSMISSANLRKSIYLDINRFLCYRKFCNKLWNASYFVFLHARKLNIVKKKILFLPNQWILYTLNQTIKSSRKALKKYRFDIFSSVIYKFIWNNFCDWYIEIFKFFYHDRNQSFITKSMQNTLLYVLKVLLRLCHPVIPFMTEKIWQELISYFNFKKSILMMKKYPKYKKKLFDKSVFFHFKLIQKIISIVRNIRLFCNIKNSQLFTIFIYSTSDILKKVIMENMCILVYLAKLDKIKILLKDNIPDMSIIRLINEVKIYIILNKKIDKNIFLDLLTVEVNNIDLLISINNSKYKKYSLYDNFFFRKSIEEKNNFLHQYKRNILEYIKKMC